MFRLGLSLSRCAPGLHIGRILFLVYINDIVKNIGCSIRLFADDTSLYIIVECSDLAARLLNSDLQTISDWDDLWLVEFHARKTMAMTLTRKLNSIQHPPLFLNNTMIQETPTHRHLGLTFSDSCVWKVHVQIYI